MSVLSQTVPSWGLSLARRLALSGGVPPMPRPFPSSPAFGRAPGPQSRRPGLRAMLRSAWRRHRTRQCLLALDAHALKDIGVTYAEAEAEANKPCWMA